MLNLRFCQEKEVADRRHMFLMFKSTFLQKLNGLKLNGKSQKLMSRLHDFIDDNIDDYYDSYRDWKRNLST